MRKLFSIIALVLAGASAWAQTGDWSGKLDVSGNSLTVVFHLTEEGTMDSPDQGAKGIPMEWSVTPTGVKVTVPDIGASFEGVFTGKAILGTFRQGMAALPLTLTPGMPIRRRPQTPVGPFPYRTEEVSFENGEAVLQGTLTCPEGATVALVLVTGSGLQNRDEEIFEHKPFAVIADALARAGIATLRYDDRGFGASTGDAAGATTEDFKADALSGVDLLRGRFRKVGVLGHSEGGTIGLMLAEEGRIDMAVSLAGNVVSGKRTLLGQNRWALERAGYANEVTDRYCQALAAIMDAVAEGRTPDVETDGLPAELAQNLRLAAAQMGLPFLRYFLTLDVSGRLGDITCPVLALNGTKDRQVNAEENLSALRGGLKSPSRIVPVDGVNHLFQHCNTGDASEYKDIEETIAPEVLEEIVTWLRGLE